MKKRTGYLKLHEEVKLDKVGLTVWAYSKRGKYVGRVEINHAGLAAFTGPRGKKRLGNLSWETLFERLGDGR
ncbi:MAG TPA: hypothetical protein VEJ39_01815 [Candidatus Acidoferrales bacterium]|nr:hypothetical protein [Candidatus Acidoferrales bacterium]